MSLVITGSRTVAELLSVVFDRIMIPLAVIVGLAGGAMIGSEIIKLQAPASQSIH